MNIVADESINRSIVTELRRNGHKVLYIAEVAPTIDDAKVLQYANQNMSLLFTECIYCYFSWKSKNS